ncbi:MAG: 4Fe-4S dicluster domain-containing protein [Bacteroidota bacterium]|nr:4Fe-4S dicluster domain-containing protein [Bacteroidota bacterium]
MNSSNEKKSRYGMIIDLDRCNGCGACTVACAIENNVPPAQNKTNIKTGITWMQVYHVSNNESFPKSDTVFVPMFCQQCEEETPCVTVCPQNAVEVDPATGIVGQIPQRCLGCRYCMAACPYHARYFNWWDPQWSEGMKKQLNPDVAPRMRGVVEKCNFCQGRLHAAKAKAAAQGKKEIDPVEYIPACVESCPMQAITFGDLADETSTVSQSAKNKDTFRFLSRLGTEPKVHFHSEKSWVRDMAEKTLTRSKKEIVHG